MSVISSFQYVNKIIEHALDTYKQAKRNEDEIDPRLEKLINRLFERNMKRRELRYVIGLALDTRRTDMILLAIKVQSSLKSSLFPEIPFLSIIS